MEWSLYVYVFAFVAGLVLAIASGFLGDLLGHGHGDVAHDIGAGHEVHVGHVHTGGHEVSAGETASPTEIASHLSPVSPPVISTFMVMFGFAGMAGEWGMKLPTLIVAPLAAVTSVAVAAIVFFALGKLLAVSQGTSHVALADLVGTEAEVITPIPAEGVGEIAYTCTTGRASCPARSEAATMIPKHSMVVITQMSGTTALVRETVDEELRKLPRDEAPKPESA